MISFKPTSFTCGPSYTLKPNKYSIYANKPYQRIRPQFPKIENDGKEVIVVHIGSSHIRIGIASEIYPKTIPILLKTYEPKETNEEEEEEEQNDFEKISDMLMEVMDDAKIKVFEKLKELGIKPTQAHIATHPSQPPDTLKVSNHQSSSSSPPPPPPPQMLIGLEAEQQDYGQKNGWKMWRPIINGCLNLKQYHNSHQLLRDHLSLVIKSGLPEGLDVGEYHILYITPPSPDDSNKEFYKSLLFNECKSIKVISEGVCAVYGAGITSAVVLDVGDESSHVWTVEDGHVTGVNEVEDIKGRDLNRIIRYMLVNECNVPADKVTSELVERVKRDYCQLDVSGDDLVEIELDQEMSVQVGPEFCMLPAMTLLEQIQRFSSSSSSNNNNIQLITGVKCLKRGEIESDLIIWKGGCIYARINK